MVYVDPPYLITCASYNENGGWTENDEKDLLKVLDELNDKKVRFALSNVLKNKGRKNTILNDWIKAHNDLTVHHLNFNYSNCNYHTDNKNGNCSVSGCSFVNCLSKRDGGAISGNCSVSG